MKNFIFSAVFVYLRDIHNKIIAFWLVVHTSIHVTEKEVNKK